MKTLYTYNPNTATIEEWEIILQDEEKIELLSRKTGARKTVTIFNIIKFSPTKEDAVTKYLSGYPDRMEELRRRSKEITMQHVAAVDLYEELTEQ